MVNYLKILKLVNKFEIVKRFILFEKFKIIISKNCLT